MQRRSFLARIGAAVGALAAARCVTPEPVWGETASTPAAVPVTIDPPYGITGDDGYSWVREDVRLLVSRRVPPGYEFYVDRGVLRRYTLPKQRR